MGRWEAIEHLKPLLRKYKSQESPIIPWLPVGPVGPATPWAPVGPPAPETPVPAIISDFGFKLCIGCRLLLAKVHKRSQVLVWLNVRRRIINLCDILSSGILVVPQLRQHQLWCFGQYSFTELPVVAHSTKYVCMARWQATKHLKTKLGTCKSADSPLIPRLPVGPVGPATPWAPVGPPAPETPANIVWHRIQIVRCDSQ